MQFPGICTDRPVQLPYCQNFHPSMPVKYGIRTDHEHRNFHRPVCCKCLGAETPTDRSVQIPVVYLARNLAQTDPCICSEYGRTASTDRSCIFGASMISAIHANNQETDADSLKVSSEFIFFLGNSQFSRNISKKRYSPTWSQAATF